MPKHKKTREQKIMADHRRETTSSPLYSLPSESLKQQAKPTIMHTKPAVNISTNSYQYLTSDLRKTAIITAVIIGIELLIYYFTKGV
jgi:hypothetical protein